MNSTDAFVLHHRLYRENSALVQFFTGHYGKMSAVVRLNKDTRGLVQPFIPLQVSFSGKGSLKNVRQLEAQTLAFPLYGEILYSGFYLNELLYHLLLDGEPSPAIYQAYQNALLELVAQEQPLATILRPFELTLLTQLGYGLPDEHELDPQAYYHYVNGEGFVKALPSKRSYLGADLLQVLHLDRDNPAQLILAKKVCRELLDELLCGRVLHSRTLLLQHRKAAQTRNL